MLSAIFQEKEKENKAKIFLSLTGFQKLWSSLPIQDYIENRKELESVSLASSTSKCL